MRKFKEKKTIVEFIVWRKYTVHVIISNDVVRSIKKADFSHHLTDDSEPEAMHIFNTKAATSYLFLPFKTSVEVAAHESWHVIRRLLTYRGAELDSETVAYHVGYLAQIVYDYSRT